MPLIETKGAASAQGFGGFLRQSPPVYIEDVFSSYLYSGNGSTQTITNGMNVSGRGGMVWIKSRTLGTAPFVFDTNRGVQKRISFAGTAVEYGDSTLLTAYNTTGFTLGGNSGTNASTHKYVAWTILKQPKFFDIVTYTGNGSARAINHGLGSVPGCIIIKCLDATFNWTVYHRIVGSTAYMTLNNTMGAQTNSTIWNNTDPTSSTFTVGSNALVNGNGYNYVAYIFAHNAGGFGLTGSDSVISCGSYTGTSGSGFSGPVINLGWEPQFVIIKRNVPNLAVDNWQMVDSALGISGHVPLTNAGNDAILKVNLSDDPVFGEGITLTSTGFQVASSASEFNSSSENYIYIAIRRGPMKVPTKLGGPTVYEPIVYTGDGLNDRTVSSSVANLDTIFVTNRSGGYYHTIASRLLGNRWPSLPLSGNTAGNGPTWGSDNSTVSYPSYNDSFNGTSLLYILHAFTRAPNFFDQIAYQGNLTNRTLSHNLQAAPELIIFQVANVSSQDLAVYCSALGANKILYLNRSYASATDTTYLNNTTPNSTSLFLGASVISNYNTSVCTAYMFASCPGVSKVGTYTGNGSSQTINCGFTGGARFVLIKRTDSSGDWYVWNTARGIVAGNDPHLSLNSTAAEVTTNDSIDTDSTGFIVNQLAATNINVSSATYIFLAIA